MGPQQRVKYINYSGKWVNYWFWRTRDQQEIDFVEEYDGIIKTYEFKWNAIAKVKKPLKFLEAYPGSEFKRIDQDNFESFLL